MLSLFEKCALRFGKKCFSLFRPLISLNLSSVSIVDEIANRRCIVMNHHTIENEIIFIVFSSCYSKQINMTSRKFDCMWKELNTPLSCVCEKCFTIAMCGFSPELELELELELFNSLGHLLAFPL